MTYSKRARTTTRRIPRILVAGLLVVIAAIAAALGYRLLASSSSRAASPIDVLRSEHRGALGERPPARLAARPPRAARPVRVGTDRAAPAASSSAVPLSGALRGVRPSAGQADGAVPDGTTVFDDEIPGVANLDPALPGALRQAATDAADDGVEFFVNSGWRSPEYEEQLLHEAVSKYGSEEEAARWVATPNTSAHVSGDAVNIGPFDATAWLSEHSAKYGLCQIYSNEPWHYELRPEAIEHGRQEQPPPLDRRRQQEKRQGQRDDHGCPPTYADPTHDPRMQQ